MTLGNHFLPQKGPVHLPVVRLLPAHRSLLAHPLIRLHNQMMSQKETLFLMKAFCDAYDIFWLLENSSQTHTSVRIKIATRREYTVELVLS